MIMLIFILYYNNTGIQGEQHFKHANYIVITRRTVTAREVLKCVNADNVTCRHSYVQYPLSH